MKSKTRVSLVVLLIISLIFCLSACGKKDSKDDQKDAKSDKQVEATKSDDKSSEDKSSASDNKDEKSDADQTGDSSSSASGDKQVRSSKQNRQSNSSGAKPKTSGQTTSGSSAKKERVWVPAATKEIYHPEEIKQVEQISYYTCQCGETFPNRSAWQAHRPDPCNGKHTYADPTWETVDVVEAAWTETIEVPAHWE